MTPSDLLGGSTIRSTFLSEHRGLRSTLPSRDIPLSGLLLLLIRLDDLALYYLASYSSTAPCICEGTAPVLGVLRQQPSPVFLQKTQAGTAAAKPCLPSKDIGWYAKTGTSRPKIRRLSSQDWSGASSGLTAAWSLWYGTVWYGHGWRWSRTRAEGLRQPRWPMVPPLSYFSTSLFSFALLAGKSTLDFPSRNGGHGIQHIGRQ